MPTLPKRAEALLMDARLSDTDPVCWRLEPLAAADAPILETALHRLAAPVRDPEEKYIRLLAQLVQQGSGAVQLTGKVRFCAADGVLRQETQAESHRLGTPMRRPHLPQPCRPENRPGCLCRGAKPVTHGCSRRF